ncbi:uncharacterized protein LOC142541788 [Primulina tabacum]|uniref:uncharacterized protein LOC142541788 n=1 Tax=Primulina tabacum TaxID=48773 RepID=UPI003F5A4646
MTCNADWKEIRENLFEGQLARGRPDLVSRVFRAKLLDLKDQILKKINSPERFDSYVVAELPDKDVFPRLFDEIRAFQDARWVSAPESVWRIFEFDLNEISHIVINLHLHLLDKHMITFSNYQNLGDVLASECISKTMLTEFFKTCSHIVEATKLLYSEFPEHFVWDRQTRTWKPRKQRQVIGRVISANPAEGERYYHRLVLLHVRGPKSYSDLLTVRGIFCFTFKEAAQRRGLLESDKSNFECLNEAASFHMPIALRKLFATILVHCVILCFVVCNLN